MELQTKIQLDTAKEQINYHSEVLLLGSCFSENIGAKLAYFKFQSQQNPFGILFHPLAIEKVLKKAIRKEEYTANEVFFFNESWHCFDAHSSLSQTSKEKILTALNEAIVVLSAYIVKASHICITLGTAWTYRNTATQNVVANCHKVPQKEFVKELLTVPQIVKSLENTIESIRRINKTAQVIFTVSPVRHLKDGFVANQRSKAHLITAIHQFLMSQKCAANCSYFPAYEIMMDELRDYRFYTSDMVHPNELAVAYIWERFVASWVDENTALTMKKVDAVQKGLEHRPFNPNAEQHQKFLKNLEIKITNLQKEYPFMQFHS